MLSKKNRVRRSNAGAWLSMCVTLACCSALFVLVTPASASLTLTHTFKTGFGSFTDAGSLAVDQETGYVYVLDAGAGSVRRFDGVGNPVPFSAGPKSYIVGNQLTGSPVQPFSFTPEPKRAGSQVAVDSSGGPTDGYIYVTDPNHHEVDVFDRTGAYRGKIDPAAAGPKASVGEIPCGVAVAPSGDVYVNYFTAHVDRYSPTSANPQENLFVSQFPTYYACNIAVDSTGTVYAVEYDILSGGGEEVVIRHQGSPIVETVFDPSSVTSVAVDPSNDAVYSDRSTRLGQLDFAGNLIGEPFPNPSGPPPNAFTIPGSRGVAVNGSTGDVYVSSVGVGGDPPGDGGDVYVFSPTGQAPSAATAPTTGIEATTATLNGLVDPAGGSAITDCHIVYGVQVSYGKSATCAPSPPFAASTPVHANVTGLKPGTTYHYRIAVTSAGGSGNSLDGTFATRSAPTIDAVSTSNLSETAADVNAHINPHGTDTQYHIEYGQTAAYDTVLPDVDIGSGFGAQAVSEPLTGLQRGVVYHFRVVAQNSLGSEVSDDQTFGFDPPNCPNSHVRQETSSDSLPDCRGYELVSPEDAGGVTLFSAGPNSPYASNPPRLSFSGQLSTIPGAGQPPNTIGDLYVATRSDEGWTTKFIGLPGSQVSTMGGPPVPGYCSPIGQPDKFQNGVLTNLNMDLFVNWNTGASLNAACHRGPFTDGNTNSLPSNSPYVWKASGDLLERWPTNFAAIPGADAVVRNPADPVALYDYRGFAGAVTGSPDLSHFVFSSRNLAFAPNGLTRAPGSVYDNNIAARTVSIISKTPNGEDIGQEPGWGNQFPCEGVFEIYARPRTCEYIRFPGQVTDGNIDVGSTSTDGSHILMSTATAPICIVGRISTCPSDFSTPVHLYMRVDDAITYDVSKGHTVSYVGMTSDAEKVFFTSPEALTAEDQDTSADLYMWREATDQLTLLSKGNNGGGNSDACAASWVSGCGVGSASTVNSNASEINGTLASSVILGNGSSDKFIASSAGDIFFYSPELLDGDKGLPGERNLYEFRGGGVQYVTTFAPSRPASRIQVAPNGSHVAFVTASRLTGYDNAGYAEMYAYSPEDGRLRCVSCNPSGQAPVSDVRASADGIFMSNDGRAFFSTIDSLSRRDTNGIRDIYEYVDGRAQLISSGTASVGKEGNPHSTYGTWFAVGLIGVSADGIDAYFTSYDTLVGQDRNGNQIKIYDARTNGGFPYVPPPAPCPAADECHGSGSGPPNELQIGTAGNQGSGGNLQPKSKKTRKQKGKRHKKSRSSHKTRHKAGS